MLSAGGTSHVQNKCTGRLRHEDEKLGTYWGRKTVLRAGLNVAGGEPRRRELNPIAEAAVWVPAWLELSVLAAEDGLAGHRSIAGQSRTALIILLQLELADHAVKIVGERGQILERLDRLLGALGIFDGEL